MKKIKILLYLLTGLAIYIHLTAFGMTSTQNESIISADNACDIMATRHGYALQAGVTGGEGRSSYVVTNTNNSGAGSYRDALSQSNRYITFAPSLANQTINLNSPVNTNANNITLDGSSASGITISKYATKFEGTNIIVAYMNYYDMNATSNEDGITFRNAPSGGQIFYIYKCHFKNATDGNIDVIWNRGNDVYFTVSHCKFERTDKSFLIHSGDNGSEGGTYYGTVDNNWFYRVKQRTPFGRYAQVHYYNNLLEIWGGTSNNGGGAYSGDNSKFLVENNIAIAASSGDADYSGATIITPKQKAFANQYTSTTGAIKNIGNLYLNDAYGIEQFPQTVPTPTYSYSIKTANNQLEIYLRDNANSNCNSCPTAGTICNDDNPATYNDVEDGNCNCVGTPCPSAGTVCNDDNPNTTNDVEDGFCNCAGTPIQTNGCEVLTNGSFDSDVSNWSSWNCNAYASNGTANITSINTGNNPWNAGFSQRGITLQQGKSYTVTFRARANSNRSLYYKAGLSAAPWTAYFYESVNLSTSMQTYTYTFTMTAATNTNASFEFFFGHNSSNVYIDNVTFEEYDCETTCEVLTNGDFDTDVSNWTSWNCTPFSTNGIANITNINPGNNPWNVGFNQLGLTFEQGKTYTITFRARANTNRSIVVKSGSASDTYMYETVNLSTSMQPYTRTFTMNDATNTNTKFQFYLGGNSANVYIDDVSMTTDCNNKQDLSLTQEIQLYPNPAKHSIQLTCELSENAQAQIQIYDAFGKLVKHIDDVEIIGSTPTEVTISQLPAGMYFCILKSDKWQAVKKFVIAR